MGIGVSGLIQSLTRFRVSNSARQITQQVLQNGQSASRRVSRGHAGGSARRQARARRASLDSYRMYGKGKGRVDVLV